MKLKTALFLIEQERELQDKKWGIQNHAPEYWLGILGEEFGEVCKAVIEKDTVNHICEELIQVAAVATAFAQCIRKNERR